LTGKVIKIWANGIISRHWHNFDYLTISVSHQNIQVGIQNLNFCAANQILNKFWRQMKSLRGW
jgi:hypothetical protein